MAEPFWKEIKTLGDKANFYVVPFDEFNTPVWSDAGRTHDWRNHVPEELQERWAALPLDAKATAFFMASVEADREVWE